jgi:regulator of protease activity HflC (stomatin/prohibitin superfamily)
MDPFIIVVLVFFVITDVVLLKSLRVVPQGQEWKVHRLGKPFKTLKPGLNFLFPVIDKVTERVTLTPDKNAVQEHKKPIDLFTK